MQHEFAPPRHVMVARKPCLRSASLG